MARRKRSIHMPGILRSIGAVRWLIAIILAMGGGWLAFALSASGVYRLRQPQMALKLLPFEANALSERADQLFVASPLKPPKIARQMARNALLQQSTDAKALRLLGFFEGEKDDGKPAKKLIELSAKLSRREAGAQLWLIESTARGGSIDKTLKHYDVLLRTKPDSSVLLFPRLAAAIEDDGIRTALLPYMRSGKSWVSSFIDHMITRGEDLPSFVRLVTQSKSLFKTEYGRKQTEQLLLRLVAERQFTEAHRLYLILPGADPARLTNPAFDPSDAEQRFGVMGWTRVEEPDSGAAFTSAKDAKRPGLTVFANMATTRVVATRLLYLQPGNYQFAANLAKLEMGGGGFLRWQMRCATAGNDAAAFWQLDSKALRSSSVITIPAGCPVQYLELAAIGGSSQAGLQAVVSSISLGVGSR